MAKKNKKTIQLGNPHSVNSKTVEVDIPDEAITYIVNKYIANKTVEGVPLVVGVSTDDVETVLGLFIEWAAGRGYVKDGILFVGGNPIG
jgi:hypothetical protein